jgi:glucose/arabinose dehydrogenase
VPRIYLALIFAVGWPAFFGGVARAAFHVERVASGLNQPMFVAQAPGDPSSLYIVERQDPGGGGAAGRILKRDLASQSNEVFLDFAGTFHGDGGAISMAFHPEFETNGKFYTATSLNGGVNNLRNRVQEYRVVEGQPQLQRTILEYDNLLNPFHTVTMMAFDPLATGAEQDYMTILLGDGGTQAPQPGFVNHAQDLSQLYGKVLRVDVSDGVDAYPSDAKKNFGIPAGNPFAGDGDPDTLSEIYASGFRSPFRGSYDRLTGDLYVGNVGHSSREEVEFVLPGEDYGWARREGTIETPAPAGGSRGDSIDPIFEFDHDTGNVSITGGYVYRGPVAELDGTYFFADFVKGSVYSGEFDPSTDPDDFDGDNLTNFQDRTEELESLVLDGADIQFITSFGEDLAGNLYIVKFGNDFFPANGQGEIFRIVPGGPQIRSDFDFDGLVDAADWQIFLTHNKTDFTGLTAEEAYARGDLDGDIDNDFFDFQIFRVDYNEANGAGAFDRLIGHVPEPSSLVLVFFAASLLHHCMLRRLSAYQ